MALGDEHFEQYVRSRSVPPPKTLYKYTSVDTARKVLIGRKLRHQSPLNYNDPFDSQWDPLWFIETPEYAERERTLFGRALRDCSTWPSDMDPELRAALAAEVSRIDALPTESERERGRNAILDASAEASDVSSVVKNHVLDLRQRMRILCLCERDLSMLMWSHYADQHRGVVMGFNAETYEHAYRRPLEKVRYSAELPMLLDPDALARSRVFGGPIPGLKDDHALVLTKSQCWEYECEWRFVWIAPKGTLGEHEDYGFPPDALTEIVFGCRTDQRFVKELTELARAIQPKVSAYSTSIHPGQFELVKQTIDTLP